MARAKRQGAKNEETHEPSQTSPIPSSMSRSNTPERSNSTSQLRDESCPACVEGQTHVLNALEKERWIRCDACKTWYHWRCVGQGEDIDSIDKWCACSSCAPSNTPLKFVTRFCQKCIEEKPSRTITRKAPARKSSRIKTQRDYASLDSGISFDPARWLRILQEKRTDGDPFRRMYGGDLRLSWLDEDEMAMREPIVIEKPEGLEIKMPSSDLTVNEIAELVGKDVAVEVIGALPSFLIQSFFPSTTR